MNRLNDLNVKQQAEKAYYANQNTGQAVPMSPDCNCGIGSATEAARPMTTAEYAVYNLSGRISSAISEKERSERVLDILTRHPEFHEFLEVLRSGLV